MTTVLLIRHGRTSANASGVLAGRAAGIHLDDVGRTQAESLATRLREVRLNAIVTSPLERCRETAGPIVDSGPRGKGRAHTINHVDDRLIECDYGQWTGRSLKSLTKRKLWGAIQVHPSSVTFPGGEFMPEVQTRAVQAVREWNAQLGPSAVWAAVTHGDVIKSVVADALGMHLDLFQRIHVDPCSVTVIRYGETRPFVLRLNDTGGSFAGLGRARRGRRPSGDGAVGGGAGTDPAA